MVTDATRVATQWGYPGGEHKTDPLAHWTPKMDAENITTSKAGKGNSVAGCEQPMICVFSAPESFPSRCLGIYFDFAELFFVRRFRYLREGQISNGLWNGDACRQRPVGSFKL